MACRLARIAMGQGLAYDTIASKVVTHRMRLLVWEVYSDRVYDEPASLKCPFQNALGKVSGSDSESTPCDLKAFIHRRLRDFLNSFSGRTTCLKWLTRSSHLVSMHSPGGAKMAR